MEWSIIDKSGSRKYLTRSEIDQFISSAIDFDKEIYSFCWFLAVTGCRISEALALGSQNIDFETGVIVIRSLKKRDKLVFRTIPIPQELANCLRRWLDQGVLEGDRLWPWCRMTGYRRVRAVMENAGITGACASPKGLRHAFGVNAVQSGVPLNMVQRWLGHADMKTTAIYVNAMGPEERELAARMWTRRAPLRRGRREGKPQQAAGQAGGQIGGQSGVQRGDPFLSERRPRPALP